MYEGRKFFREYLSRKYTYLCTEEAWLSVQWRGSAGLIEININPEIIQRIADWLCRPHLDNNN